MKASLAKSLAAKAQALEAKAKHALGRHGDADSSSNSNAGAPSPKGGKPVDRRSSTQKFYATEEKVEVVVYHNGKAVLTSTGETSEEAHAAQQKVLETQGRMRELKLRKQKLRSKIDKLRKQKVSQMEKAVQEGSLTLLNREMESLDDELAALNQQRAQDEYEATGSNDDMRDIAKVEAMKQWKSKWANPNDDDFVKESPPKPKVSYFERVLRFVWYVRSLAIFKRNMRTLSYQSDRPEQRSARFKERHKDFRHGEFDDFFADMKDYMRILQSRLRVTVSEKKRQHDLEVAMKKREDRRRRRLEREVERLAEEARLAALAEEEEFLYGDGKGPKGAAAWGWANGAADGGKQTQTHGASFGAFLSDTLTVMSRNRPKTREGAFSREGREEAGRGGVHRVEVRERGARAGIGRPEGRAGLGTGLHLQSDRSLEAQLAAAAASLEARDRAKRAAKKQWDPPLVQAKRFVRRAVKKGVEKVRQARVAVAEARREGGLMDKKRAELQEKQWQLKKWWRDDVRIPLSKNWWKRRRREQRKKETRVVLVMEQQQRAYRWQIMQIQRHKQMQLLQQQHQQHPAVASASGQSIPLPRQNPTTTAKVVPHG